MLQSKAASMGVRLRTECLGVASDGIEWKVERKQGVGGFRDEACMWSFTTEVQIWNSSDLGSAQRQTIGLGLKYFKFSVPMPRINIHFHF